MQQIKTFFETIGFFYFNNIFLYKYADFSGRARRRELWWAYLWYSVFQLSMLWGWDSYWKSSNEEEFAAALAISIFVALISITPLMALTIRRFHDVGLSGWWWLLTLIPILGGVFLLIVLLLKGQPKANAWGPIPSFESETEDEKNFRRTLKKAYYGDRDSQYFIGWCYWKGEGVETNKSEAKYWFEKASKQGEFRATNLLALKFTDSDEDQKKLRLHAAVQGDPDRCFQVAIDSWLASNDTNCNPEQTPEQAFAFLKKSAESNFLSAFQLMGIFLNSGYGTPKKIDESAHWWRKGADLGCGKCCFWLGELYSDSNIFTINKFSASGYKDLVASVSWYKKSSELGYGIGQVAFADKLKDGNGCVKSEVDALKWALIAKSQITDDDTYSLKNSTDKIIDELESKLSRDEIQKAQSLASQFSPPETESGIFDYLIPKQPKENIINRIIFFLFPFLILFLSFLLSAFIIGFLGKFPDIDSKDQQKSQPSRYGPTRYIPTD